MSSSQVGDRLDACSLACRSANLACRRCLAALEGMILVGAVAGLGDCLRRVGVGRGDFTCIVLLEHACLWDVRQRWGEAVE